MLQYACKKHNKYYIYYVYIVRKGVEKVLEQTRDVSRMV